MDDLFDGGGHQDVALLVQHVLAFVGLGSGETDNGAGLNSVVLKGLEIIVIVELFLLYLVPYKKVGVYCYVVTYFSRRICLQQFSA